MEALGRLTGGVAHDFNNLLTPIVGGLDLLRMRVADDPKGMRYLERASSAADRAKALVGRHLSFARRQTLAPRVVDLAIAIENVAGLLEASLSPDVRLKVEAVKGKLATFADPSQLELALLNLAINARDAMPAGGLITLSAGLAVGKTNHVRITVADTGSGMDEATLRQAIDPFFTTKAEGAGTGLGLSMVHGFAAQSGGSFELDSRPGTGTRATIVLPTAELEQLIIQEERPAAVHTSRTVLLVDDDEDVRLTTAAMLENAGHTVLQASSADQALALLKARGHVDAVITDYLMPGRTGLDLIFELEQQRKRIPVMVITGYMGQHDPLPVGIMRMRKPFNEGGLNHCFGQLLPLD